MATNNTLGKTYIPKTIYWYKQALNTNNVDEHYDEI